MTTDLDTNPLPAVTAILALALRRHLARPRLPPPDDPPGLPSPGEPHVRLDCGLQTRISADTPILGA